MIPNSDHNQSLPGDILYSAFLNYEWRRIVVPCLLDSMKTIALSIADEAERITFENRYGMMIDDFYDAAIPSDSVYLSDLLAHNPFFLYEMSLGNVWQDSSSLTMATADGDVVGRVEDLSVNKHDLLQATTGNKLLLKLNIQNGFPVLRADGTDDYMAVTLPANTAATVSIVAVLIPRSMSTFGDGVFSLNNPSLVNDVTDPGVAIALYPSAANTLRAYRNSGARGSVTGIATDTPYIITSVFDGTYSTIYRNGTAGTPLASGGNFDYNRFFLSARWIANAVGGQSQFDYGAIACFNLALSSVERAAIETLLNNRWQVY
jgi:hypothetical protein